MIPLFYTTKEGGLWKKWDQGNVDMHLLEYRRKLLCDNEMKLGPDTLYCNGREIHAFQFSDNGKALEWDSVNGWRSAKKA